MASAPRAGEKTEPRSLFDRLQDIDTRLLDFGAAIVLSAFGIVTVLTRTAGDGFRSDDLLGLALVLAQTAPLALRRMSPLGVLVVISVALVAHSALGYEVVQAGTSGSLVSLYGATASTDSRGSTAAAAITAAAIVGFFATNRGDYGLVDIAAISVTWAMAWFLGTYVKLERRVRTRTRELQTLLEMSRSVTSTLDLQQLYEVALDHLQELIPYTGAAIQHLTEDGPQQVATRRPLDAKPNRRAIPAWYQTNIWARLQRGEPVVIDDIRGDEPLAIEYREASGDLEEAGLDYFRSWMSVPLMVKDRSIGAIGIVHRESGFFTASQVSLAQNVANQVAIAIENARLFEESARRTRNLQALLEMSQAVASTLDLEALFEVALDKLKELIPYTGANLGLRIGSETVQVASRRPAGISRDPVKRAPNWEAVPLIQELLSGRTLVIPDVRGDDPQAVQFRATFAEDLALTNMRYFRALVTVPLIVKSKVIGDLSVSHEQPGFFQPEHVELAQSLANQVAVAIENARLFEESGRRAKELAALLELSRSIASTLDVQQLFEVAIERIRDVVPYTGGSIGLRLADGQLHSVVRRPRGDARSVSRRPGWTESVFMRAIRGGQPILIDDIRGQEPMAVEYRSWLTEDIEDTPLAYVRSMMAVPMVVKGTVFGDITLTHEEPAHFTQDHVVLIQNVANHLAVAIENARLFEETDRKAKELEALYQADQKLFASLDLDDVLQSLADIAVDVLGADKSLVSIAVAEGGRMTPRAWRNISEATREFYRGWEPGSGKPGFLEGGVVASGRDDIPEDTRRLLQKEGIIATLDVPIIFEGHTRGAFGLGWTRPHESSESEKASAFALAQRAAVAIQNADLYARAQQAASLEERQRLARELHDSVSQALYGIALGARTARTQLDRDPAKAAEPMDYVLSLAEAGLAEMRALIFELRPESLATEGLVAALEKQVAAVRSRHGLSVSARLCREPEVALEVKEAIYRIAQEALHNVVKHAQATSVVVELADSEGRLMLTVSDDGRGFDAGGEYPGHMGLDSMRERAEKAGGIFTVDSAPGRGTRVSVQFSSRS